MAWHPALKKMYSSGQWSHINFIRVHLSLLHAQDNIFQQQATESSNGSHHLVIMPSCPKQLSPTSQVFVPCMLIQVYLLSVGSYLQSSTSSEASHISIEKKLTPQNCPSPSPSCRGLLQCLEILTSGITSNFVTNSFLLWHVLTMLFTLPFHLWSTCTILKADMPLYTNLPHFYFMFHMCLPQGKHQFFTYLKPVVRQLYSLAFH